MMTNDKNKDERLSLLLSAIEQGKTSAKQQFLEALREQSANEFQDCSAQSKIESQVSTISFWRMIMKSRITKTSVAAAIIILAVIFGISQFGGRLEIGTVAWADVVKPILNAKTVVYTIIVGEEGTSPPIQDMIMGSRIRRSMVGIDAVTIIDLETSRILTLDPKENKAIYIDMKGLPKMQNYLETLRSLIVQLQENPHFVVEELGEREIDGQRAIGFKAAFTGEHPNVEVIIWADPETALPIRIEQQMGQMRFIGKDFQFDVDLDEALFSMEIPAGYTEQQAQELDLFGSTEEDFVEGLRIWAKYIGDGEFPGDVSIEYFVKQTPMLQEKFENLNLSDEEELEVGMKMQRHLLFIRFFKGEGKWHYAGKGVKLGEADKAIFWYRPKGSPTYRVVYGDLSVKDINAEDLPN